jgi:CDP-6-deoxy-D-xylo-4-hexulose-3-dehydrase
MGIKNIEKIKLMKSSFYKEWETKEKLCKFIQKTNILSMGEKCREFEKQFAHYQGRKFCVIFNSGSSANLALIQALLSIGLIEKGDGVAFSALTWATNVMPIIQLGLVPIPIDVTLDTLNISSDMFIKILIKSKVKALFLTNLLGLCDDIDNIKRVCDQKTTIFLEDNCESIGTIYKGVKLGNFGYASTFSFYVGHHMSTIEGGAVCTDDKELCDILLMIRAHGWDRNLDESKKNELKQKYNINDFYSPYTFYSLGYNLRPTEITGFLGMEQLKYIDEINLKRNENFLRFFEVANKNDDFFSLKHNHIQFVSNFAYPIICKSKKLFKKYIDKFGKAVEIRPIVAGNILKQPFFKFLKKNVEISLAENADIIHNQGFYFTNNPELMENEIQAILSLLSK